MEDIEKLRVRVEKDPNSRLFLPLAEEYRKSGMPDEAITVILRGLENQPGYTSARVALGRIYLEKNMLDEARSEFEAVVSTIPDNLFAHKKLADIYRARGETEKEIAEYKTVIELNPLDEDARMCLCEMERDTLGREPAAYTETETPSTAETDTSGAYSGGEPHAEMTILEETSPGQTLDSDFEKFSSSFPSMDEEEPENADQVYEIPDDRSVGVPEESSFRDILKQTPRTSEKSSGLPETAVRIKETVAPLVQVDLSAADAFIAGGNFRKALEAYKEILAADSGNKQVLQRVAELKSLMKMMGKGDEVLISRLESFLGAVTMGFRKAP